MEKPASASVVDQSIVTVPSQSRKIQHLCSKLLDGVNQII